jgi:exopolysaccharide/PEP-CTERM locus tyrosine autokinase
MSLNDKEDKKATIAELVSAETTNTDTSGRFFKKGKKVDVKRDAAERAGAESNVFPVLERLRAANMLVDGSQLEASFYDEYRRIKRPLLSNAFGKTAKLVDKGNLILLTSSIPGEGKTYTSINLALSIAHERDHTVLLVDCDATKQGSSGLLGITEKPGLVELLESDDLDVGDVILRTDIPKLCLISSGKQNEYVTELLASQRMVELVNELGNRYQDRVIIFDGPPILSTPQTQVLTGLVGQIVFVIEAGKTPQAIVEEALSLIPKEHATGLVLNKNEGVSSRSGYYGYYGHYGDNKE